MRILLLFLIISSVSQIRAQSKVIKTFSTNDTVTFATLDRAGDLYLVTRGGQLQKLDGDGQVKVLARHSQITTLFDPRDGGRLFSYDRSRQQYDYLDSSLEIVSSYRVDSAFVIEPWLICPTADHRLWLLDAADHSLKKLNPRDQEIEVEVLVDDTIIENARAFTYMREYQGFVFLLNPTKGILIFNSLGRYIRAIEAPNINSFGFIGEELYFSRNGVVTFFNLFTAETRVQDISQKSDFILFTDQRMVVIRDKSVTIFQNEG